MISDYSPNNMLTKKDQRTSKEVLFFGATNWGLSVCSHCTHRSFCTAFSKAVALRVAAPAQRERKNAISFLLSFFLCGFYAKEKSVIKGKLSLDTKTL